jgi:hypothetical protein
MAQPQKTKSTRSGTKQSSARARTKSTSKSGGRSGGATRSSNAAKKTTGSKKQPVDNAAAARKAAGAGTRAAGHAIAAAARRAKVPLVIGGAATAGLAGGLAVKARAGRSSRRRGAGLPLPLRDGKLDLEAVESAAKRLSSLTSQIGDIAGAMQRRQT